MSDIFGCGIADADHGFQRDAAATPCLRVNANCSYTYSTDLARTTGNLTGRQRGATIRSMFRRNGASDHLDSTDGAVATNTDGDSTTVYDQRHRAGRRTDGECGRDVTVIETDGVTGGTNLEANDAAGCRRRDGDVD